MKVSVIANTSNNDISGLPYNNQAITLAGQMAGICYMSDDYTNDRMNNQINARKRAERTSSSGHYSVFEHYHVNLLIEEVPKLVAMFLNNLSVYCTSERSGRYTVMKPNTALEQLTYDKWRNTFTNILKGYGVEDAAASKIAQENARYLTSVFIPTTMAYTIPYSRLLLVLGMIKKLDFGNIKSDNYRNFYKEFLAHLIEFKNRTMEALKITDSDLILDDHKNVLQADMLFENFILDKDEIIIEDENNEHFLYEVSKNLEEEHFGTVYNTTYLASFTALAQLHRHRRINYTMRMLPARYNFNRLYLAVDDRMYIPDIILNTPYEIEWKKDYNALVEAGIIPQATLVIVHEYGRFIDFVNSKCKERLCSRAQYETSEIVRNTLEEFIDADKLNSFSDNHLLNDIIDENRKPIPRCQFKGYTCKEPCALGKYGLIRSW